MEPTRLGELFRETGRAHHQAFLETDGEDPEWPLWYAEHLLEELRETLDPSLTRSRIVHGILTAEEERERSGEEDWAEFYATFFHTRYGDR